MTPRKHARELLRLKERLPGFSAEVLPGKCGAGHRVFLIQDDAGNQFKAFAPTSPGSNVKRGMLNFKCDVRQRSNKLKGLLD